MTQLKVLSAWNILPAALLITAGWFLLDDNPSNTYTGVLFLILFWTVKSGLDAWRYHLIHQNKHAFLNLGLTAVSLVLFFYVL
ncbi:hypothetical protein GLW03_15470 [Halobacillus halophilus]|uniref:hypothetical protein n=1 Tax=Halobacillus TaxID=45667 RepID=UPI00136EC5A1|nr:MULTISPECIES: hypothetical protein [Halobacillus]MCA1023615.1 hypothetical protein [Halobacillus litoralis]MYL31216.1 hypothetical protein [Halobacillus halophilus]